MAQSLREYDQRTIDAYVGILGTNQQVGYLQIPSDALASLPLDMSLRPPVDMIPKNNSPHEHLRIQSTSGFFPECLGAVPGAGFVYRFGKREDTFYCIVPKEDLVKFRPSMLRNLPHAGK